MLKENKLEAAVVKEIIRLIAEASVSLESTSPVRAKKLRVSPMSAIKNITDEGVSTLLDTIVQTMPEDKLMNYYKLLEPTTPKEFIRFTSAIKYYIDQHPGGLLAQYMHDTIKERIITIMDKNKTLLTEKNKHNTRR